MFGPALLSLFLLPVVTSGHTSVICSASDSNEAGKVSVFLGTYHSTPRPGGSVPGTFELRSASNQVWTGKFDDFRASKPVDGTQLYSDDLGERMVKSLRDSFGLNETDMVHCYKKVSSIPLLVNPDHKVFDVAVLAPEERADPCYPGHPLYTWYRATGTGATAGKFSMFIDGTDINLNPSTDYNLNPNGNIGAPCSMSKYSRFALPIAVGSNGKRCSPFPSEAEKIAMGGTVSRECMENVSSGFICPITCPDKSVGQVLCDDGVWFDDHKCTESVCTLPQHADFPGIGGIEGFGCGFTTSVGTTCEPTPAKDFYLCTEKEKKPTVTCELESKGGDGRLLSSKKTKWKASPGGVKFKVCPGKGTSRCFPTTTTTTITYTGPCTTVTSTTGPCGVAAKFSDQPMTKDGHVVDADHRTSQPENSVLSNSGIFVVVVGASVVAFLTIVGMFARRVHQAPNSGHRILYRSQIAERAEAPPLD